MKINQNMMNSNNNNGNNNNQSCKDVNSVEFEKVKKEQSDIDANININVDPGNNNRLQQQQILERPVFNNTPSASNVKLNNGFHAVELLQDILKNKFSSISHHTTAAKHEKIRLMLEDSISEESRTKVQEIYSQVEQMKTEEKLLLYLKLPSSLNSNGSVDPLRQPLNPLGNRCEIHQTIMWIKTHLEEDPEVSLPKQEVYDEYNLFCMKNSMKPLSTADFGKVMKQVYPRVRPRRLGTRGNSRYCYAGMRKRIKLDPPSLKKDEDEDSNISEDMLGAASKLIREWAESLLNVNFQSLNSLGKYLVRNLCVDTNSLAAVCILSDSDETENFNKELRNTPLSVKTNKLREAQLQLQKKLQNRENERNTDNNHSNVSQNQGKEKKNNLINKESGTKNNKKSKKNIKINNSLQCTNNNIQKTNSSTIISKSPLRHKKVNKNNKRNSNHFPLQEQSNCDNLELQPLTQENSNSPVKLISLNANSPKEIKNKNSRKRTTINVIPQVTESSPEKQFKILDSPIPENQQNLNANKISVLLTNNLDNAIVNKTNASDKVILLNQLSANSCDNVITSLVKNNCKKSSGNTEKSIIKNNFHKSPSSTLIKNKLNIVDNDTLNEYLNGSNSQEQEEELLQYFQQSNSSSSDKSSTFDEVEKSQIIKQDKVSQLRIILNENLNDSESSVLSDNKVAQSLNITKPEKKEQISLQQHQKSNIILPTLLSHNSNNNNSNNNNNINNISNSSFKVNNNKITAVNTRRRVSFENNIVEHVQNPNFSNNCSNSSTSSNNSNGNNFNNSTSSNNSNINNSNSVVPQSPNTRRRIFNFTPISPGPQSPINMRSIVSSSANASPFVSPRNTPVPRSRSSLRNTQKTVSRSISCNAPCSLNSNKNDIFIVPANSSQSPLIFTNNRASQVENLKLHNLSCPPIFTELTSQEPLLINYPSQENLQEIKNVYNNQHQPAADLEISELLRQEKQQFETKEQLFYRSQSAPLHRMVNPALLSPISSHHIPTPTFNNQNFNTPVPSEFNDFVSVGDCDSSNFLLEVDPNLVQSNQQFLTEENILDILNQDQNLLVDNNSTNSHILESNTMLLNSLPNPTNIDLNNLSSWTCNNPNSNQQKMIQSRSYPNTPLPIPAVKNTSKASQNNMDDINESRSYPSTPMLNMGEKNFYVENKEPMLFNPRSVAINIVNNQDIHIINNANNSDVDCNVADLLDSNPMGESDDINTLSAFEELNDVDALTPLFTEVVESNN